MSWIVKQVKILRFASRRHVLYVVFRIAAIVALHIIN
jgi:hypothetical protein